jgi:superfamily II DNA helicase RecQ
VPCQEEGWRLRFIVDYLRCVVLQTIDSLYLYHSRKHEGQSGIIFAGTHNKTERVCKQLGDAGIENVDYYHSDRPDTQDILERFQTGKIRVVVSTVRPSYTSTNWHTHTFQCAFGEGIDKQDSEPISFIFLWELR